jgi:KDO2-lipid IV(A) lauroyltransferase
MRSLGSLPTGPSKKLQKTKTRRADCVHAPDSKPGLRLRARQVAEYFVARMLICLLQTMPGAWFVRMSRWFAWLAHDVLKIRRRTTMENLQHVFPHKSDDQRRAIALGMWEHLFLMVCEIAHAPRKIHDTNWRDYIRIRDKALMTEYFLDWRPVVLVSGHLGNFELAVFITGILGIPTYAIARPLDNPWLDRWLRSFREQRGQFILPTSGSAAAIQRVLDGGGMLSLLGDQHAGNKGCWVEFMGRPASCHKALALFTLVHGAPMLVSWALRRGEFLKLEIGCSAIADPARLAPELCDVRGLTQWYNQRLEELVRLFPEQYWWVHRRWKDHPRRAAIAASSVQTEKRAA